MIVTVLLSVLFGVAVDRAIVNGSTDYTAVQRERLTNMIRGVNNHILIWDDEITCMLDSLEKHVPYETMLEDNSASKAAMSIAASSCMRAGVVPPPSEQSHDNV